MTIARPQTRSPFRVAFTLWWVGSVAVAAMAAILYSARGTAGFSPVLNAGPISDLRLTLYSTGLAWLLLGVLLFLLASGRARRENALAWSCFAFVAFLYLNILRERQVWGDISDYIQAAMDLDQGQPLHPRYLYPPLWADLLQWLAPLGPRAMFDFCWLLNFVSLLLLFPLLQRTLRIYGFPDGAASVTAALFMAANVSILRTLGYVQVNLHVINLVLASLLLYRRSVLLSAAALALAVHLKTSPAVLALAFLVRKDWRWAGSFLACLIVAAGATALGHGTAPFMSWLGNLRHLYEANGINFRETSVDSLFRSSTEILGIGRGPVQGAVWVVKALFLAAFLRLMIMVIRGGTFRRAQDGRDVVYNAVPVLSLIMVLLSPLIWEHHGVFAVLPFLVALPRLADPADWAMWGSAYFLVYLVPTFDFYPWSYGRLAGYLLCAWVIGREARREPGAAWIDSMRAG